MQRDDWGRFTCDGSDALEARIRAVVLDAARAVEDAVGSDDLEALVLAGGYGRGEGGVELRDGSEAPHNNLDFVLIARRGAPAEHLRRVGPPLRRVGHAHGIRIDLACFTARRLRHAEPLVFWVDMKHGHKTVLGNPEFVPSLGHLAVSRIRPWDARNLLTNRGTLLVINDLLLENTVLLPDDRRLLVKHLVKAVIGAGDATLFFLGDYDPSYAERQRRMRRHDDVPVRLRALYDECIAFRFRPAYADWGSRDLRTLSVEVKRLVADAHRFVEAQRLGRPFETWEPYLESALRAVVLEEPASAWALARKVRNAMRSGRAVAGLPAVARLGLRLVGRRGVLPLVFPAAAYDDVGPQFRERAAAILESRPTRPSLARAYLRAWSAAVDPSFAQVATRHRIKLEEVPSRSV